MLRVILLSMLSALALANPSGTYSGSVTKLGQTVNAQVEVASDTSLNLSLSGILELDCAAEAYHLDGSSVTLDNLSDADDCIAKTLSEENVELKTIVYDEDADTITVSVKYSVMSIDMVLSKAGMDFDFLTVLASAPEGSYAGSKTILGETINAAVAINDDSTLDFTISGVIDIDCAGEEYTMSGDDISVTHVTESGDCAHDALDDNSVTLKSITYDEDKDEITVSVKYSVMSVDITLTKTGLLGWKVTSKPVKVLTATPTGTYKGSVTKLGQTVNTQVDVVDDKTMNLIISGPISISCSGEEYTLSGDEVTVDHITEAGDCAHDALDDNNVELKGITYDESKDEITVSVKYSVLSLDIVLGHQAAVAAGFNAEMVKNLRGSMQQ
ncbi:hypothetical protein TeGR_g247 [Tetraparma gracilis]|jgi:hypothetical protein|uniref:Uncharacterized protein n=1 Tax=Tetraparma gracilis TaxID=2962635 RepID=A0ABQ6MPC1_9STRA|nr:hypothetical protein TeGR_g247 [Tetraparma gracilis]